jgi:hypothetical protein
MAPLCTAPESARWEVGDRQQDQPCLCLCRGFVQMTMVRPCRLITRHRSHMGLTDALTFIWATTFFLDAFRREPRSQSAV